LGGDALIEEIKWNPSSNLWSQGGDQSSSSWVDKYIRKGRAKWEAKNSELKEAMIRVYNRRWIWYEGALIDLQTK
jgi:hypothetical protein